MGSRIFRIFVLILILVSSVTAIGSGSPNSDFNDGYIITLQNDLENLPDIVDGISSEEKTGKDRILGLLNTEDMEVKQAFFIMAEYGTSQDTFEYSVPEYNTQLEVLLWLTEKRDISGHERLAMAIALDYGAVLAICEDDVKNKLKKYIVDIYDYFIETDDLVSWNVDDYSLEALVPLVWGADSISTTHFFDEVNQYPEGTTYGDISTQCYLYPDWVMTFNSNKLTQEDFEWYFVDISSLEEMRSFLLYDKYECEELSISRFEEITNDIDLMLYPSLEYHGDSYSAEIEYIEVDGKITSDCGLSNPDWHWNHFKHNSFIIGCCRDVACMDTFLLKSINIPSTKISVHWDTFGHQIVVFYDQNNDNNWKIPPYQISVLERNINGDELFLSNFYPIIWLNWHDSIAFPPRSYVLLPELKDGFDITPPDMKEFETEDWNPWDDLDSEDGIKISTNELQSAIHYWLNDMSLENTNEIVTTDRLQYLIHLWLEN